MFPKFYCSTCLLYTSFILFLCHYFTVGPTSKHLMKASVSIFSDEDCRRFRPTGNKSQLMNGIDASSQLCAGEVDGARDTCQVC